MRAPRTSHHMVTRSHLSMFAAAETPVASSSRLQMSPAMDTTSWSGWQNNRSAMAKSRCGAVPTRDSINGRRRKNSRHISRRSFPPQPLIHRSIILRTTMWAKPTTCSGSRSPTGEQLQKITLQILTITGQYDGDELGALAFYRDHLGNVSPEAGAKHFLIIGPWDHAGTRTPTDEVGGVKLGPAAIVDLNDLHRQWYDWTMKNGPKPEFLKNQ